jgi:exodeoxyribonuclease V alpha subunit
MNNDASVLQGTVESVIYHNEDNGFTVFTLQPDDHKQLSLEGLSGDTVTCTAHLPGIREGEVMKLAGTFVNNPRYGRQLQVSHAQKAMPNSLDGIEKYLGSGVIKGVGARTAKRIVEAFGTQAFDIIEAEPEKLTRIRGINLQKALRISEAFHSQAALRKTMLFLQEYGVTPLSAMKIYKQYKENTIELVRANPYRLADDIDGIGFKTADAIASKLGIAHDAQARISAGVRYILWEAAASGHTYLPLGVLRQHAEAMLGVRPDIVEGELLRMQMERLIYREKPESEDEADLRVFLSAFYYAELNVARKIAELCSLPALDKADEVWAADGIQLSLGQQQAIKMAVQNGVLVITGGPGTGKTTAINTLIHMLKARGCHITLAAPTGRAAKRMTEATGHEAGTLHRLLESTFIAEDARRQAFNKNEDNPIETDVLIVDEVSMMDILLAQSLLKAVARGTRLILVGDVDQLPSVGPGNVLKDIIHSGCVPVVRLEEIFRQAQESAIVMNAHRINHGEYPVLNEKNNDFFFVRRGSIDDVQNAILELVTTRLPAFKDIDISDIQVLTPMRKSALGVASLNTVLQHRLNPPHPKKKEREYRSLIFREGDKVMQIKNNYATSWKAYDKSGRRTDEGEGVYNGDCGIIKHIDEQNERVTVLFDDSRQVEYDFSQLDELELAYAITIHKSQGSEYRAVVIPVHSGPPMLLSRNLLYTAVTRARELAVLVGLNETLYRMVDNNREVNRYTALAKRLRVMFNRQD